MIQEKVGTRDLDDSDASDGDEGSVVEVESDAEEPEPKRMKIKKEPTPMSSLGPIARRPPADRLPSARQSRNARAVSQDLISSLSHAFDPAVQAARDDQRTARMLQSSQILTLAGQLREVQNLVESLRDRLSESEKERNAAERRADRAEMMAMIHRGSGTQQYVTSPPPNRDMSRPVRMDIVYPDGGGATRWYTPGVDPPPDFSPGTRYTTRYTPEPEPARSSSHPLPPSSRVPPKFRRSHTTSEEPPLASLPFEVTVTPSPVKNRNSAHSLSFVISPKASGSTSTNTL